MIKIMKYGEVSNSDIFARAVPAVNVEDIVADIIKTVRAEGDTALLAYCEKFDRAKLTTLRVSEEEIAEAVEAVGAEWVVVEQDKPSMGLTSMESAKKSIDYLRSIMK